MSIFPNLFRKFSGNFPEISKAKYFSGKLETLVTAHQPTSPPAHHARLLSYWQLWAVLDEPLGASVESRQRNDTDTGTSAARSGRTARAPRTPGPREKLHSHKAIACACVAACVTPDSVCLVTIEFFIISTMTAVPRTCPLHPPPFPLPPLPRCLGTLSNYPL